MALKTALARYLVILSSVVSGGSENTPHSISWSVGLLGRTQPNTTGQWTKWPY